MPEKKYTHVAVEVPTQRKISVLAKAKDMTIYSLVEAWAEEEWQEQRHAGLVTDAMIGKSTPTPKGKKS